LVIELGGVYQELAVFAALRTRGQLILKFATSSVDPEFGRDIDPWSGFTREIESSL
jgi:hypothetical protein